MPLDIRGQLTSAPRIRAGFIGCGSHAYRNIFPTFQFAPVELVATCDLNPQKAAEFARTFGGLRSYSDHREMLDQEELDAVFIVTNYDEKGRPRYVSLASDCLRAGRHVWMEKPPAASTRDIEKLRALAGDLNVMVGFKKMFFPSNEKAHELMRSPDFGMPRLLTLQYPQFIPPLPDLQRYRDGEAVGSAIGFLDHLCHPVSALLLLFGMPNGLYYDRAANGAGVAVFTFDDGRIATLTFPHGAAINAGMERTTIVSERGRHIVVDNNLRVTYHRDPPEGRGYGTAPSFYSGNTEQTSAVWEPEFSLGQLYNKGLFLLGYYAEVAEFARAILEKRPVIKGHLGHAHQATRIFEAFAEGCGKQIPLHA